MSITHATCVKKHDTTTMVLISSIDDSSARLTTAEGVAAALLAEWRLPCRRPVERTPAFCGADGGPWREGGYNKWRQHAFRAAVEQAGVRHRPRPYDLSTASPRCCSTRAGASSTSRASSGTELRSR